MRLAAVLITTLSVTAAPAAAQTTARATSRPATATAPSASAEPVELLDEGRVRITPPPGWTFVGRTDDGMSLRYNFGDNNEGIMSIIVTPQTAVLQSQAAEKMGKLIGQKLREAAQNQKATVLTPPRVVPDGRFFLKIRDRQRGPDGVVRDQLQIYRSMQLELLHVAVIAMADTEEAAAAIHAAGEEVAQRARLGTGPKPSSFRRARVKLTIPPDWTEQRTDDPNGVVAVFKAPDKGAARLVVRSKIVPKGAKASEDVRKNTIEQLMDIQRHAPLPPGSSEARDEQLIDDPRFARRLSRVMTVSGEPWKGDFRCMVVGDVVIGVESLAPVGEFQAVSKLADEMALSIKPLDDRKPAGDSKSAPPPQQQPNEREQQPTDRPRLPPTQTPGIPGMPGLGI